MLGHPVSALEAGNHVERINVHRVGIQVARTVNDLIVQVHRGVDQGRLHDALPAVIVHVVVHPLLVAYPRELLLLVPKEVLGYRLRRIINLGDAACGVVLEFGQNAVCRIPHLIQLVGLDAVVRILQIVGKR